MNGGYFYGAYTDALFATPLPEAVAKADGPYQLHSLDRAVSVLEVLGESDTPLSLAEICQRMRPAQKHGA